MSTLQNKNNNISILIYEENKIPRHYQFKKITYHFFLYTPVLFFLINIFILFGAISYTEYNKKDLRIKEPFLLKELRKQNIFLSERIFSLKKENKVITTKLTENSSQDALSSLGLFQAIIGQKDLTNPARLFLQDFKVKRVMQGVAFKFNIKNITLNNVKIAGYIHVFASNKIFFTQYPKKKSQDSFSSLFTDGEPFASSRYRPVSALFSLPTSKEIYFKIIIFNRTGDLIHQQQFKYSFN